MPLLLLHGERRMTRQLDKQLYGFLDTPVLRATLFVDNLLADVVRLGVKLRVRGRPKRGGTSDSK